MIGVSQIYHKEFMSLYFDLVSAPFIEEENDIRAIS